MRVNNQYMMDMEAAIANMRNSAFDDGFDILFLYIRGSVGSRGGV